MLSMKAKFLPKRFLRLPLAALALTLFPAFAHAQDPYPAPTPPDPLAGVPVQVLDQQQVEIGTHKITFNRIAPPTFPARTPAPQAAPTAQTTNRSPQTRSVIRSAQTNDTGISQPKQGKILFLSATVYDRQFTEVRSYGGVSPELRAYVNIDFNYFSTVSEIETADTVYLLMFGLGNDTADALVQRGGQPPNLAAFPQDRSAYQIIEGSVADHAEDIAALDALCVYYDVNKAQMVAAYNQQQADNAARAQWLKDHPPVQPDTVINYWPVKNSVYLNQSH
jgi:hypothetical protein